MKLKKRQEKKIKGTIEKVKVRSTTFSVNIKVTLDHRPIDRPNLIDTYRY